MAAEVLVVPTDDWKVISQYLQSGTVLVSQETYEALSKEDKECIDLGLGSDEYDFGGEADVWIDIIRDDNSYYLAHARKYLDDEKNNPETGRDMQDE